MSFLVKDIAENVDSLLHRGKKPSSVSRVSYEAPQPETFEYSPEFDPPANEESHESSSSYRVSHFPFRPRAPMANPRSFQPRFNTPYRPSRPPTYRPAFQQSTKPFCQNCFNLGKKLNLIVNYSHPPQSCPQAAPVRHLQSAEQDHQHEVEGEPLSFQNSECLGPMSNNKFQTRLPPTCPTTATPRILDSTWMEDISSKVRNIETRLISSVRKEKSPSLKMSLNSINVFPTIDEGSEINVLDHDFAQECCIQFSRSTHNATAAGSQKMIVTGETTDDVILHKHAKSRFIRWNLKKCVVVKNLGCPILIGEPGKVDNFIQTIPSSRLICTNDVNGSQVSLPYETKLLPYNRCFICRSSGDITVYPEDEILVELPAMLVKETSLLFSPRQPNGSSASLPNQTCQVKGSKVPIKNNTASPILISKKQHFGDLTPLKVYKTPCTYEFEEDVKVQNVQNIQPPKLNYLNQVSIDPDNILSDDWKSHFRKILSDFEEIITPTPGCYNGYYGNIDCSLNFIQPPPSSNKARLPQYSHEKLVEMSLMMDQMEEWGVLKKPHELGITVKNVHTSYLVPKSDGKYRFVTDFTSLLPFIGKVEVISTTIAQAKRILSSFKYFIELDLSHCFWQGPMSNSDSSYLATPHPFGGLRVYAREPQGIRNASEHNSERLSFIFGDLERDKKMTRMADGLYIGGHDLTSLSANFVEVLKRAKNAGLTFKPSKIIICPQSTILFGWKKCNDKWSPTNHVISPLACSPPPKTVKQLRGWIGAYRQVAETIPNYSITLGLLERETGGKKSREEIKWTPSLLEQFTKAKSSLKLSQSITIPLPSDTLHIYPDFSADANAIGGHLIIERSENGQIAKKNGGFFSVRLDQSQSKWSPCEKETLGIKLNIEHFRPFIQESLNTTIIHPDNMISVHAWNRLKRGIVSSSSKVAAFLSSLSENNIDIKHCPGVNTKVADFNSRNPLSCNEPRCQICKYMSEQCLIGEHCVVNNVTVQDILSGSARLPLTEKPAWLQIQKEDDTHNRLFKLISSGGLQPEKKLRGQTNLKLMYNLYKRGLLKIDASGVIVIKHIDTTSGLEYDATSIPTNLYPSIIQSLHIKLQHPSRNQMHRFAHRFFHCTGSTQVIDDVHKSCQTCTSLSKLPTSLSTFTTDKVDTFGSSFSADVMVSDSQKILICREKLTQFTFSKIIVDETAENLRQALLEIVLDAVPDSGCTIRVDAAPGLQSLNKSFMDLENDDILRKLRIFIEIGRAHNPNKNPIGENAIKEFRKEKLRLHPQGGPLSEMDRVIVTRNINSRIRNRNLSSKEMFFRRDLNSNKPIPLDDDVLSQQQFDKRTSVNEKNNSKIPKPLLQFSVGDRVYFKNDLSKLKSREEYVIRSLYKHKGEDFADLNKSEKQFRKKNYSAKLSDIIHVSTNFKESQDEDLLEDQDAAFSGFPSQPLLSHPTSLQKEIKKLEQNIPKQRGRPKLLYPDYLKQHDISEDFSQEQFFHGFSTQDNVNKVKINYLKPPTHGWLPFSVDDSDDDEFFDCFPSVPLTTFNDHSDYEINNMFEEYEHNYLNNIVIIDEGSNSDFDDHPSDSSSLPTYISSDDDPSKDEEWWDAAGDIQSPCHTPARMRSETDPFFLMRAQLVSTDESSLESDNDLEVFDSTIVPSRSQTPLLSSTPLPDLMNTVCDVTSALQQLHEPVPDTVVQLAQPLPLPRLRPKDGKTNYKRLHSHGKH